MRKRKQVTSAEVAEYAGVSRATVSAVINKTRPVSSKLVQRIEAAMLELDYQPNALARSLKGKKTHRIGLVVGNAGSPFWAIVINAIERVAYAQGFHVMLGDSGEDPLKELDHLQNLSGERVEGIIVGPCGAANREYILRLSSDLPVVLFDRRFDAPIDSVTCDNELGAYLATSHFIERVDIEKIACLAISQGISPGLERVAGYKNALAEHNIPFIEEWVKVGDYTDQAGYQLTLDLLKSGNPPRAIFASSHLIAIGALRAIRELCLTVPDDVAIIGFDDTPWAPFLAPPLTVVAQPVPEMAIQAAEILLRRIYRRWNANQDPDVIEQILHRPKLIVRESCGYTRIPCGAKTNHALEDA